MTGVKYLTEVEKIINEITDEEFLKLFGGISDMKCKYIFEEGDKEILLSPYLKTYCCVCTLCRNNNEEHDCKNYCSNKKLEDIKCEIDKRGLKEVVETISQLYYIEKQLNELEDQSLCIINKLDEESKSFIFEVLIKMLDITFK